MSTSSLAFLLRYQEPVAEPASLPMAAGTMTKTGGGESHDQDLSTESLRMGTQTQTEAREQTDQDVHQLLLATQTHTTTNREETDEDRPRGGGAGTQTRTDARESDDTDAARQGWAIIPRA